jgi:hypothetical protein
VSFYGSGQDIFLFCKWIFITVRRRIMDNKKEITMTGKELEEEIIMLKKKL